MDAIASSESALAAGGAVGDVKKVFNATTSSVAALGSAAAANAHALAAPTTTSATRLALARSHAAFRRGNAPRWWLQRRASSARDSARARASAPAPVFSSEGRSIRANDGVGVQRRQLELKGAEGGD